MEIIEKNDVSRAIMERFCAKCSNEDNCIDACTVCSILDIINNHTITFPSCDDCEYHEDIGVLPEGTYYCNVWETVVRQDDFCSRSKKATYTKVNWRQ